MVLRVPLRSRGRARPRLRGRSPSHRGPRGGTAARRNARDRRLARRGCADRRFGGVTAPPRGRRSGGCTRSGRRAALDSPALRRERGLHRRSSHARSARLYEDGDRRLPLVRRLGTRYDDLARRPHARHGASSGRALDLTDLRRSARWRDAPELLPRDGRTTRIQHSRCGALVRRGAPRLPRGERRRRAGRRVVPGTRRDRPRTRRGDALRDRGRSVRRSVARRSPRSPADLDGRQGRRLGGAAARYRRYADRVAQSFERFWNGARAYCFDVLDGPAGDDPTIRPNALFAVALEHPALAAEHHRSVVDTCARLLLTSYGLRSLEPGDPRYVGKYVGDQRARDACYHQGTVWAWLIAPFIGAHLRVYRDPHTAASYLEPFRDLLESGAIGTIGEIYDGDPPFAARGCFAQAWS